MRRSTVGELAQRYGLDGLDGVGRWSSFGAFSTSYRAARAVLRSPDDLRRLVDETIADGAADGAVWIEPQTSISSYAHIAGGEQETLELLLEAGRRSAARHGVGFGLIIAANREHAPAAAQQLARLAARYAGDGVVGFGLGGDERHRPEPFRTAFDIAADAGLLRVPHAGEQLGAESVRAALGALGPERIQHGVRAIEDPELVARLAAANVCLDVCPSSNVALGVFPKLGDHPLPDLLSAGVACSLNADGPLLFDTSLLDEYAAAREQLRLTDETLAAVARASIDFSAAPEPLRGNAIEAIDAWLH